MKKVLALIIALMIAFAVTAAFAADAPKADDKKAADDKKKDADAATTITGSNDKPADHFEVGRAKNGGAKIDYAATVRARGGRCAC